MLSLLDIVKYILRSFDSPFAPSIDLGYPDIAPPPPNRIERLNALLERVSCLFLFIPFMSDGSLYRNRRK